MEVLKMEMNKMLLGAMMLSVVSSCEYKFDVTSPVKEPRMVMEGIIGLDGTDYIKLMKAVPVGGEPQDWRSFTVKDIHLSSNGEELSPEWDDVRTCYVLTDKVKAGSKLTFSLSTVSEPEISAATVMPSPVMPEWTYTVVDDELHWKMRLPEDASGDRKFALMSESSYLYELEDETPVERWSRCTINPENVSGADGAAVMFSALRQITYRTCGEWDYDLTLLREAELTDGVFYFITTYNPESKYKMILLNLSEQAYGYFNALYNQDNNFLGRLGFSPANFAYTNVSGGYGVFGAVSRTETLIDLNASSD